MPSPTLEDTVLSSINDSLPLSPHKDKTEKAPSGVFWRYYRALAHTYAASVTRDPPHHCGGRYSLIAPVQAGSNVTLHILHPVVGQMAHQHLPPQIQDFIHDVPQPVEEIAFISLGSTQTWKRWSVPTVSGEGTTQEREGQVQLPSMRLPLCGQTLC